MASHTQTQSCISEALQWAFAALSQHSESANLDAEILLQHSLGKSRTFLYTWPERQLTSEQWKRFEQMVARRVSGVPVAHIIGEREFWSLRFMVNETTLIPRPDTEILVETALNLAMPANAKVLDLGTGTGAIALALASERPNWRITALDKVLDAVELAKANRDHLGFSQVEVLQSDWFSAVNDTDFHLIVSNPPYIDEQDEHLAMGDVRFEPLSALTAADQGYADLNHIALHAREHLLPGGYLLLEHGYAQALKVRETLTTLGYQRVATVRDFGSNERCTLGCWRG